MEIICIADQARTHQAHTAIRGQLSVRLSAPRPARLVWLLCSIAAATWLAVFMAQRSALAATITVESLSGGSSAIHCTLRDAIRAANLDQPAGACGAGNGDDTILIAVTGTLALTGTLPVITTSMSIVGPGPASLSLWRNPTGPQFRFVDITATTGLTPSVVISGLRMVNGAAGGGNGGAIQARNYSGLTVLNAVFENNTAQNGGAIHIRGPLTVENSLFVNNSATNAGGAAFTDLDTIIINSVFIGNAAYGSGAPSLGGGGAVRLNIGPNRVVNSVFARNWIPASAPGGAVFRISSLNDTEILHCTIVGEDSATPNSAIYTTNGGGVSAQVRNTIIASHTIALHRSGSIAITEDFNLFHANVTNTLGGSFGTVLSGGNSITGAPQFVNSGQNNFRLMGDSPAINAGADIGIRADVDGITRPLGLQADIGAFEHWVDLRMRKTVVPSVRRPGGNVNFTLAFSNAGAHGASGVVVTDVLPHGLINITTSATLPVTVTPGAVYRFHLLNPLAPGAAGVITLSGVLSPDLPPGPVTNTATIGSQNWETTPLDNTSAAVVTVSDGERISKWAMPPQQILVPGQRITYTVVVSAPETSAMGYMTLTDAIPAHTHLVTDSVAGTGVVAVGAAIVMTQINIPAGGVAVLTFAVVIDPALASSAIVTNVAQVRSDAVSQMSSNVVTREARVPASIALAVAPPTLPADDVSSAQVTVTVADAQVRPVPGLAIIGQIAPGGRGGLSLFDPTNAAGQSFATWYAGTRAGPATITVSTGLLTASTPVTLTPGAATTITVQPNPATVAAGATLVFTATGVDLYNNVTPVSPVWTTNGGVIDAGGVFTAQTSPASGRMVTATQGAARGAAIVHVTAGAPYTLSVSASPGLILANGISASQIMLTVVDPFGNATPNEPVTLTTSLGQLRDIAGATDLDGRFTSVLTSGVDPGPATVAAHTGNGRSGAVTVIFQSANTPGGALTGTYTVNALTARPGDLLTFTLLVTNVGVSTAQGITLSASIPDGAAFPAEDATAAQAASEVVWTGDLAPGAQQTLSFSVVAQATVGRLSSRATGNDGQAINFELSIQIEIEPAAKVFMPVIYRPIE